MAPSSAAEVERTLAAGGDWPKPPCLAREGRRLADALGLRPLTGRVLAARGLTEPAAAREFLHPHLGQLADPFLLPGAAQGVARLEQALAGGEEIVVYGDYDVDGQVATALLVRLLRGVGGRVRWYVPDRLEEGYGLNSAALELLAGQGAGVVVTVDCGVRSVDEVALARASGLDVVITDHHEPGPKLPPALAVVNPRLPGAAYPFRDLAGVGVAYQLGRALYHTLGKPVPADLLELVALGTVADVMPLQGENRVLVAEGLRILATSSSPGLRALREVCGLGDGPLGSGDIAFGLAPRLNAAGRLADASIGIRLLLTAHADEARSLAAALDRINRQRQALEAEILGAACAQLEQGPLAPALVTWGPGWHPGVVGIVAARLVERYRRPAVVLGVEGDEARGSARSVPGFPLHEALEACRGLLDRFGGHALAAGLTLRARRLEELRECLAERARKALGPDGAATLVRADCEADLAELDEETVAELQRLAPFGAGNPAPVLLLRDLLGGDVRKVGRDGAHLRCALQAPGSGLRLEAVGFRLGGQAEELAALAPYGLDVLAVPALNRWQGRTRVELRLRDLRPGSALRETEVRPAASASRPARPVPGMVRIVDRRGRAPAPAERGDYLAGLVGAGRSVIALPDPACAGELAALGLGSGVRLLPWERAATLGPVHGVAVVLLSVPAEPGLFGALVAALSQAELHLAFGPAEVKAAARRLAACYPGREGLRQVYRALRDAGQGADPAALARTASAAGPEPVSMEGVCFAFKVFGELGLIEGGSGTAAGPRLLAVSGKLDLSGSISYNEGARKKQQFASFSRAVLEAEPGRLLQMAREGSWGG